MKAVEVRNLKKSYGELQAVNAVDFTIEKGEILSLLGPNGAGKSSLISMISGLLTPDDGDVFIMGYSIMEEPVDAKARLGVVPQDIALYPDLSARENLFFWGKMYGLRGAVLSTRVDKALEIIGLKSRQNDRVEKYSGGMKRRLNIGVALLHKPDVLIMDEPTVGIDPHSRRYILDNIKDLNREGMVVLHTTHRMEEAAELADHIAIMDLGRIIAYGTHRDLIDLVGRQTRIDLILNADSELYMQAWESVDGVFQITADGRTISVLVDDSNQVLPLLFETASRVNVCITAVDIQRPNLETVFLHLTGRTLRD
ncbi:MAG: ABC transporter ATP-binding protein [Anaerolineales bacterium]|jgi:ABC-2 type transport system ATP-binding protein